MSAVQLEQIVQAIIVSRIRYALPAWSGFLTVELMNKLESTLKRLVTLLRLCLLMILRNLAHVIFFTVLQSLHEVLSCYAERPDSLRPRGHDYVLPVCSKILNKQSFLVRSLFDCV